MNKPLIIIVFLFTCIVGNAQEGSLAIGGEATGSGGTVSYSIGQVFYQYSESSTGSVSQGVQQAYEIWVTDINEHPEINLSYFAYPNPTLGELWLTIIKSQDQRIAELESLKAKVKTLEAQASRQDQLEMELKQIKMLLAPQELGVK